MNDFQIISKLGEGANYTEFKVKGIIDQKIYTLKKVKILNLSEKEKQNSLNEVRILASVKSIFVVSYKEAFFDEKDNTLCIVMEFADRGDLYQKIVQHKKSATFFEESDIWRIFIQLVKGLKALHDLKIIHRDIKPANVFLFSNGSAKLGNLNVCKVARRGLGYTQTGTPSYCSPEVWKNKPYDNKADVWSLGCVLYEMITLRPPFRAQDMEGLYKKVIKGQYNRIPERFSDDLFQVVQFLLQVNASSRPSCEQILSHPAVMKSIEYFKSFARENNQNSLFNLNSEIINLKNEIKNKDIIIQKLNLNIKDLQNKLDNIENLYNNQLSLIKELHNNINIKEKELQQLKIKLNQSSDKNNSDTKYKFSILFLSKDEVINYPITCQKDDLVSRLEEELYNKYPDYKEYNTYLTCKNNRLERSKTIGENNIKKGDVILINISE